MSSGRGVSGHLPSERSACLTELQPHRRLFDLAWGPRPCTAAEHPADAKADTECQGRYHPDEGCQGICLLNAARVLQTQSVKVDVVRTRGVRAFAFWTQCVYFRRSVTLGCFTNGTIAQMVTNSLSPLSGQHLYDGSGATV